jgi:hypothetical protein
MSHHGENAVYFDRAQRLLSTQSSEVAGHSIDSVNSSMDGSCGAEARRRRGYRVPVIASSSGRRAVDAE